MTGKIKSVAMFSFVIDDSLFSSTLVVAEATFVHAEGSSVEVIFGDVASFGCGQWSDSSWQNELKLEFEFEFNSTRQIFQLTSWNEFELEAKILKFEQNFWKLLEFLDFF